jgi:Cd2+/Zn2+-exporting ATPase
MANHGSKSTSCSSCACHNHKTNSSYSEFFLSPSTIFTIASTLLLIIAMIQSPDEIFSHHNHQEMNRHESWLYLLAAIVGSAYIWYSALQGIRRRDFTADIPVTLATIAAIAIGQYAAAAVVAVMLLIGGLLESFIAARAQKALTSLVKLLPDRVTIRYSSGDEVVSLSKVNLGDLLLVHSGERIAADGEVVSGIASINQAAITGESLPIDKTLGDKVFAGTLNLVGTLVIKVTHLGENTTLGQIQQMIEVAQKEKAPIQRLLDKYAKYYTPAAIISGLILWAWTGNILQAITMLIVFCPCVMVLATPTALVAAIGNAALRGSLIKKGATIETLAKINTFAFDKTGTLTLGEPELVDIIPLSIFSSEELLLVATQAEKFSEHPLGRAVVKAAIKKKLSILDPIDFQVLPGLGISAQVNEKQVLIGKASLLLERGIIISENINQQISQLTNQGRSVILLAINQQIAGLLIFADQLRPEANITVAQLRELRLSTLLVSGDSENTTRWLASKVGITNIHSENLPANKAILVKKLQLEGKKVAFVGDGINDGPALAHADVGIAMGVSGTDVAIDSAQIALLKDDLLRLPYLISLSRQTVDTIKYNLIFSLVVLAVAIGLTFWGILTPVTGALLHELSSIPVIINSVRLIAYRNKINSSSLQNNISSSTHHSHNLLPS